LAPKININYCIENSATNSKVAFVPGSEYVPIYPDNCMIYGPNRRCARCAAGYHKHTIDVITAGYGNSIDKCVLANATDKGCGTGP
jgi:hypothetical protein